MYDCSSIFSMVIMSYNSGSKTNWVFRFKPLRGPVLNSLGSEKLYRNLGLNFSVVVSSDLHTSSVWYSLHYFHGNVLGVHRLQSWGLQIKKIVPMKYTENAE